MTELFIWLGALLLIVASARIGMNAGPFPSLVRMLIAVLSLLAAQRYWFLLAALAAPREHARLAVIAAACFWPLFIAAAIGLTKLCADSTESVRPLPPSLWGDAIGGVFGLVTGVIVVTTLLMTLDLGAAEFWPAFRPNALPLPIDRAPIVLYHFVERNLAGVHQTNSAHTLLPDVRNAKTPDPSAFWR